MSDDYKTEFLDILDNESSFLILARGNDNLESLQKVCTQREDLGCLTIRYSYKFDRTESFESLRNTLIFALIRDLQDIVRGTSENIREIRQSNPKLLNRWQEWLRSDSNFLTLLPVTEIEDAQITVNRFLRFLWDPKFLPKLNHLVIFAEIGKFSQDIAVWEKWATELQEYKPPERLGFVLSGLPEKFKVFSNIHEIDLPPTSPREDSSVKFKSGSASSDRPTDEDYLGFQPYAEGLAGLLLHSKTQPPLTIGIYGRWGQGKSSFMEMIDRALVEQVYRLKYEKNKRQYFGKFVKNQGFQRLFRKLFRPWKWEEAKDITQEILEWDLERNQENVNLADFEKKWQEEKINSDRKKKWWQKIKQSICQDLIIIHFDAWQYEDAQQIWAGLAHNITQEIEEKLSWFNRRISLPIQYTAKHRAWGFLKISINFLLFFIFSFSLAFSLTNQICKSFNRESEICQKFNNANQHNNTQLPWALSFASLICFVVWERYQNGFEAIETVSERISSYMSLPNYRKQMGYQHQVINDLKFLCNYLHNTFKVNCKLVVFIDDLDRCSEENIIEILQAIHLILAESKFFVFLGIDTEMIERAIWSYYRKNQFAEPLPPNFPESYLKKIIQLSFNLPKSVSDHQRYQLIESLFSHESQQKLRELQERENILEQKEIVINLNLVSRPEADKTSKKNGEVEDTPEELKAFEDYQKFIPDNPREMKRLVNIHRLIKIMLRGRISSWLPDKQRKLVKWLIFCTKWSNLVDRALDIAKEKTTPQNQDQCILKNFKKNETSKELIESINLPPKDSLELIKFIDQEPADPLFPEDIQKFELATKVTRMIRE